MPLLRHIAYAFSPADAALLFFALRHLLIFFAMPPPPLFFFMLYAMPLPFRHYCRCHTLFIIDDAIIISLTLCRQMLAAITLLLFAAIILIILPLERHYCFRCRHTSFA